MSLSSKKQKLLYFIHRFGYVRLSQAKAFNQSSYGINSLIKQQLITKEKLLTFEDYILKLTSLGKKAIASKLPLVKNIGLSKIRHNLMVVDLYLVIDKLYNLTEFITEREYRKKSQTKHIPDFIIKMDNPHAETIAVELELSNKNTQRRNEIFSYYIATIEFSYVWYIYDKDSIKIHLSKFIQRLNFINLIPSSQLLQFDSYLQ